MNLACIELVTERFVGFTQRYIAGAAESYAYTLKVDHTFHVLEVAKRICQEEKYPEDVSLALCLGALLHDVGRFPQYLQFHTFRDRDSVNHAALSVRYILREKMLQSVPAPLCRLVLGAVYLHNTRELPKRLNPTMRLVAEAVRDSDKLDIMRVMIEHFAPNRAEHPEVSLDAKEHPTNYSDKVINAVLAREVSDYRNIVWVNDFKLLIIGWLYDLNTRASRRLLRESNRLEGIFALLPKDEKILALHAQIQKDLADSQ